MKKFYLLLSAVLMLSLAVQSQTTVFFDDFEAGVSNWVFSGTGNQWGLTTTQANSPTHSLTESPFGNSPNSALSYATMANGVDLGAALSAQLSFYAIYDIEQGFDYMYVQVSTDNFATTPVTIATFNGEGNLTPWVEYTYDLGGYVGNTDVKIRFCFDSDGNLTYDGMYIDDFTITSDTTDNSPPLIVTTPPVFYQGALGDYDVTANIIDISGLASTELKYKSDGIWQTPIAGVNTPGTNTYTFTIPMQVSGSWVDYVIEATDASASSNIAVSDTGRYIAGNYVSYDDGIVDFYGTIGPTSANASPDGAAVRFSFGSTDLVTILIRNYTDINTPCDPYELHIWNDNGGVPGTDLITPFIVTPESDLLHPEAWTRIDMRGYGGILSGLSGDYWIGFTNTTTSSNLLMSQPGVFNRSYDWDQATNSWTIAAGSNGNSDYHFRCITTSDVDVNPPLIDVKTKHEFYEGVLGNMTVEADISDNASGVDQSSVVLKYTADGVQQTDVNGVYTTGVSYTFTIPQQPAGTMVKYVVEAADLATPPNVMVTDTAKYIAGQYFKYDDPADTNTFYLTVNAGEMAAVRVSPGGVTNLVTALIRNYDATGNNPPQPANDPFEIHIWANSGGLPGADLITPFSVTPWADYTVNSRAYTVIDLRPHSAELSNLVGDFFIGYSVPTGICNLFETSPGNFGRSFSFDGTMWVNAPNLADYHFRCVTSGTGTGIAEEDNGASVVIYPNPSTGQFNFALNGMDNSKTTINIYDLTGKQVYSVNKDGNGTSFVHVIDLSGLAEGMYIAEIQNGSNVYKEKIIIQ